jgi:hypothetical protein
MASAGGAYVVRDDGAGGAPGSAGQGNTGPGNVDKLFPYTLKGLTDALEEARFRSYAGPPQVVMVMKEGSLRAIRRYEQGRERPARDVPG